MPVLKPGRKPTASELAELRREVHRVSRQIADLPNGIIAALAPVLADVQDETARALRSWLEGVDELLPYTVFEHRRALSHLQSAFEAIATLEDAFRQEFSTSGLEAAREAVELTVREFARFRTVFDGIREPLSIDVNEAVRWGTFYVQPSFNVESQRFAVETSNDLERLLSAGIGAETIEDVELRMVRLAGPFPREPSTAAVMAALMAGAFFMRTGYRAERLIRTEVQGAANVSTGFMLDQLALEIPGLVRRWDAAMDGRTCATCRALAGQVTSLHGKFYALGDAFDDAPAHPNCRCRVDAWHPRWDRYLGALN
jgi:hypothetical protein